VHFSHPQADILVPAGNLEPSAALQRVTHLCVAAHQDDIEIMAHAGICDCLDRPAELAFGGVVVTNGAGSPRSAAYAEFTDERMQEVRRAEQREAATLGHYQIQIQLAHPSAVTKSGGDASLDADLDLIFSTCSPQVLYLHNPADKHDTHVGVLARCLEALRRLPAAQRPARVLGCEVWRDLDWLVDADKVPLDAGRRNELAADLLKAFDSQISGGKRYDLATLGRRSAHATFHTSHATDNLSGITWAVDLTPLVTDERLSMAGFVSQHIRRFHDDVLARIERLRG
jgi:LmbE family N-acetylglucosaminyl deacetylase